MQRFAIIRCPVAPRLNTTLHSAALCRATQRFVIIRSHCYALRRHTSLHFATRRVASLRVAIRLISMQRILNNPGLSLRSAAHYFTARRYVPRHYATILNDFGIIRTCATPRCGSRRHTAQFIATQLNDLESSQRVALLLITAPRFALLRVALQLNEFLESSRCSALRHFAVRLFSTQYPASQLNGF